METELIEIIKKIDEKIKALQNARKTLLEEFGRGMRENVNSPSLFTSDTVIRRTPTRIKVMTRKGTISKLLREHGPMKVTELQEKTGFSRGTIGWVLNDKEAFVSLGEGKWDLVKEKK